MLRPVCWHLAALFALSTIPCPASAQVKRGGSPIGSEDKTFPYKKTPQGELSLHVHFPAGWKATDRRPVLVFFFGGGWTNGNVRQFEPQSRHFAERGLVAIRADYRVKSRHGVRPDACVEDAKGAVRWVRQNAAKLGVDPDRIVAAGGSAGAHIAACTALAVGLDVAGEDHEISSRPNALLLYNPVLRFAGHAQLAARLGDDEKLARAISPTLHLTKTAPPTLLLYGKEDRLVAQGEEFAKRAGEVGHRCEMFLAEGVGHGFFNKPPWLDRTTQRADEFLQGLGYLPAKAK
jgi:acetyl esterase/lipase